jgi:hypothetical protein
LTASADEPDHLRPGGAAPKFLCVKTTLNSQKTTHFISTELVWRFNWFGR